MPGTLADRLRRARPATVAGPCLAGDDGGPPEASSRRRRRRTAAAVVALIAAAAAVALVVADAGSSSHPGSSTAIPSGDTTATVERRTLTEHTSVSGTLGYGSTLELYDRVAGTFTWLPGVGAVIGRGGTLWRLNNLPVVLMYGSIPAYRTLAQGVSDGPDVAELNSNLTALGFDPYGAIGDRSHFGEATATAVRRWQAANGLPETGKVELGRVLFAPGARRVTALHVALGQDPPAAAESDSNSASEPSASGSTAHNGASTPPAKHKTAPSHSKAPSTKKPPSSKQGQGSKGSGDKGGGNKGSEGSRNKTSEGSANKATESDSNKGNEDAGNKGSGNGGGNGTGAAPELVLGTTSTQQIVQLQVKANQQQLARLGEKAPITLPDGSTVDGTITGVGTVATESSESEHGGSGNGHNNEGGSGNGENATIPVTLSLDRPVAHLDKAPVSVQLVEAISRDVLTVPAAALIAAGGGYAVQAVEGGRRTELAVTPGMFADGYVQVEGAGLREGLTVLEPR